MALPKFTAEIPDINPMVAAASNRAASRMAAFAGYNDAITRAPAMREQPQSAPGMTDPSTSAAAQNGKYSDAFAGYGFADNVPRSLIKTESGGNWAADNGLGYHGILQFGDARLTDAKKAGVVPTNMTLEQFGSDTPEGRAAQVAAANWHFSDIDSRIRANHFDQKIGQQIGGTPVSWDGMRAMAHLGGFGGLARFINSGGKSNPKDAFGTSLAAYGNTHTGA